MRSSAFADSAAARFHCRRVDAVFQPHRVRFGVACIEAMQPLRELVAVPTCITYIIGPRAGQPARASRQAAQGVVAHKQEAYRRVLPAQLQFRAQP